MSRLRTVSLTQINYPSTSHPLWRWCYSTGLYASVFQLMATSVSKQGREAKFYLSLQKLSKSQTNSFFSICHIASDCAPSAQFNYWSTPFYTWYGGWRGSDGGMPDCFSHRWQGSRQVSYPICSLDVQGGIQFVMHLKVRMNALSLCQYFSAVIY